MSGEFGGCVPYVGVTGVGRAEGALRSPRWPHLPRRGADGELRGAAEGEARSPPRPLSPLWGAAEVEARLPPRPRTPLSGTAEGEALPPPRPRTPCAGIPSNGEAPLRGETPRLGCNFGGKLPVAKEGGRLSGFDGGSDEAFGKMETGRRG